MPERMSLGMRALTIAVLPFVAFWLLLRGLTIWTIGLPARLDVLLGRVADVASIVVRRMAAAFRMVVRRVVTAVRQSVRRFGDLLRAVSARVVALLGAAGRAVIKAARSSVGVMRAGLIRVCASHRVGHSRPVAASRTGHPSALGPGRCRARARRPMAGRRLAPARSPRRFLGQAGRSSSRVRPASSSPGPGCAPPGTARRRRLGSSSGQRSWVEGCCSPACSVGRPRASCLAGSSGGRRWRCSWAGRRWTSPSTPW